MSDERFLEFEATQSFKWWGLTVDHRLRRGGSGPGTGSPPPRAPVRQVVPAEYGAFYLLADGRLAGRGFAPVGGGAELDDRFKKLVSAPRGIVCGLNVDGGVQCITSSATQPGPGAPPYVDIAVSLSGACGLEGSGAISCWQGSWAPTGSFVQILSVEPDGVCGVRATGEYECAYPTLLPPPPGEGPFTMLGSVGNQQCGLRPGGELRCWPAPAPAWATGRRFKGLSGAPGVGMCAVELNGKAWCSGQTVGQSPWDDFKTVSVDNYLACGVREDDTAACWWVPGALGEEAFFRKQNP